MVLAGLLGLAGCPARPGSPAAGAAAIPIDHIIVIFLENHTFDNLYGLFPGANGIERPGAQVAQVDRTGQPYRILPPVINADPTRAADRRFPPDLPNRPFPINRYVSEREIVPSPVHRFYQHQLQMNGGRMDRYVAWTDSGALPMGYWETSRLPLARYAREYTLADNFFSAAFGGSYLNHMWLVCSCTPVFPNAPPRLVAQPLFDGAGRLLDLARDGDVTPDGFVVNDLQPLNLPHGVRVPAEERVPPQTFLTIGDRLSEAGVSWAWYAGG